MRYDYIRRQSISGGIALAALLVLAGLSKTEAAEPNIPLPGVVTASGDHTIKKWDKMGKLAAAIGAHDDTVVGVAFSDNGGMTLVSAGTEGKLKIWNVPGARPTLVQDTGDKVLALAVSPDGKTIATAGRDSHLRLWNIADGAKIADLQAHADPIRALQFASNTILVSGSDDKTLRVWNVGRNKNNALEYKSNIVAHDRPVTAIAVSPDGKLIASVSEDSYLKIWRLDSGGLEHRVRAGDGPLLALAFSPDGKMIATGDESGKIKLWDTAKASPIMFSGTHDRAVTALAFASDSKVLVSGGEDRTLRYWNVSNGQLLMKVAAHDGAIQAITVVP